MRGMCLAIVGILLSGGLVGAELDMCAFLSELACIKSADCKLVQLRAEAGSPYKCRSNANACEVGFVQHTPSKAACESNRDCVFQSSSCYCPPDVICRCGGG